MAFDSTEILHSMCVLYNTIHIAMSYYNTYYNTYYSITLDIVIHIIYLYIYCNILCTYVMITLGYIYYSNLPFSFYCTVYTTIGFSDMHKVITCAALLSCSGFLPIVVCLPCTS